MNSALENRSVRRFWQSTSGRTGLFLTIALLTIALLAPILQPYERAIAPNFAARLQPPSLTHLLGTDGLGRDFLTLIWFGIRTSLLISLVSVGVGATIGLILGLIAGYFRGLIDLIISWIADILLAFPSILLAIAIATIVSSRVQLTITTPEQSITRIIANPILSVIVAIGVVQIPIYVRLVRSVVLSLREQDFIQAATAIGATSPQILLRHILPGSLTPIVVQATLSLGTATLEAAGLGFLGLGAQPPTPELGTMLSDAFRSGYSLTAPWATIFPGLAITIVVLAFNLLGDGLRDGFDPRSR